MPRYLKTLYPCATCGTPCEVQSRRSAEWAMCLRCHDRQYAAQRWGYKEREAHEEAAKGNKASEAGNVSLALVHWSRSIAAWLEAAAYRLERKPWRGYPVTTADFSPAERRALVTRAVGQVRHARECLGYMEAWCADVLSAERGMAVIQGGGEAAPAGKLPTLRVFTDGEVPRVVFGVRDD